MQLGSYRGLIGDPYTTSQAITTSTTLSKSPMFSDSLLLLSSKAKGNSQLLVQALFVRQMEDSAGFCVSRAWRNYIGLTFSILWSPRASFFFITIAIRVFLAPIFLGPSVSLGCPSNHWIGRCHMDQSRKIGIHEYRTPTAAHFKLKHDGLEFFGEVVAKVHQVPPKILPRLHHKRLHQEKVDWINKKRTPKKSTGNVETRVFILD